MALMRMRLAGNNRSKPFKEVENILTRRLLNHVRNIHQRMSLNRKYVYK